VSSFLLLSFVFFVIAPQRFAATRSWRFRSTEMSATTNSRQFLAGAVAPCVFYCHFKLATFMSYDSLFSIIF